LAALLTGGIAVAAVACSSEEEAEGPTPTPVVIVQTVLVPSTPQVIKETVVVPGTPQVIEKTVIVAGTPQVVKETVVVKETAIVVQTATPTPVPVPKGIEQVAQPNPKSAVGSMIVAVPGPLNDENGLCRAQACEASHYWTVGETLFLRGPSDETLPWIGTTWKLESGTAAAGGEYGKAGIRAEIKIRKGIKFHAVKPNASHSGDWGEVTAEDVAFTINDANMGTRNADGTYKNDTIHGQAGDFDLFEEVKVVDAETIRIPFASFDSTWHSDYLNQSGQAVSIMSKKAHDYVDSTFKAPGDFVRTKIVETGPYQIESWTRDDKVTQISRYTGGAQHYVPSLTPKTARITQLQSPDPTARVALLRSGDVDAALIQPKDAPQFTKDGKSFLATGTGGDVQLGIFFSGNLWETVNARDGTPLNPFASGGAYQQDWPWIGDPRNAEDLAEARLIRHALAMAYDREAINQALLGGLGTPVHVEYVSIKHPRYQKDPSKGHLNANGTVNIDNLKWPYKYDVAVARALINSAEVKAYYRGEAPPAGGPLGTKSFETSLYAGPELGGGASVTGEVVDAVAGYWQQLGIKVFSLKFAYQTFRPSVVNRTNTIPWVTSCDKGRESNPWSFPKGLVQTSLSRGGFSCGFEDTKILDFYRRTAAEQDPAKAAQIVDDYITYMHDQALMPGVVAVPDLVIFNAAKIKAWPMPKSATSSIDGWYQVELQAGK
jgi:ABC-type transport system substrate-binding protein